MQSPSGEKRWTRSLYSFKDYLKTLALNMMHQHPTDLRPRKAYLSCSGQGQGWLLLAEQS